MTVFLSSFVGLEGLNLGCSRDFEPGVAPAYSCTNRTPQDPATLIRDKLLSLTHNDDSPDACVLRIIGTLGICTLLQQSCGQNP